MLWHVLSMPTMKLMLGLMYVYYKGNEERNCLNYEPLGLLSSVAQVPVPMPSLPEHSVSI
jgi:hypothetical protein